MSEFRERMRREIKPVVIRGVLGWGNRKNGLEAYGPGGRWEGKGIHAKDGDLLGDALDRAGAHEGATLLVIAVDRFGETAVLDEIQRVLDADPASEPCRTCADAGWVGSRTDPTDCPTCGRKPYWLVGDGTYPAPPTTDQASGTPTEDGDPASGDTT